MLITCCCMTLIPMKSHAIVWVVVQAAAKKVIKAIDLQVQRLQNKTIGLQNAQKTLENAMSKLKLSEISDWVEKQRKQYEIYYNELWKVRSAITYYRRIKDIMAKQVMLVDEYKRYYGLFKKDQHFTPKEIDLMSSVYSGIMDETVKNIDLLFLVVNSFSTEMSDAKRLEIVSTTADRVNRNFSDLRTFNNSNALLSIQRGKDLNEVYQLKVMYGLQ